MDTTFTVHLIRHAPTESNVKRRYLGWTDEPIVDAASLAPMDRMVRDVIGSDLKRCQQTAKGYFPNAVFHGIRAFREMDFGDFECKSYEELKDISVYRDWIDRPFDVQPPNGESFQVFQERVLEGFRSLQFISNQYFVLHGGVIRLLLMAYAPEEKEFWDWQVPHGMRFSLTWDSLEQLKEGRRCTSLSVEPITANDNL